MMNEESGFLLPILVTALGRSGSTLVMSLLAGDERCVFDKIYPLESRYLSRMASFAAEWSGWTFQRSADGPPTLDKGLGKHPVLLRRGADQAQLLSIPSAQDMFLSLWHTFEKAVAREHPQARFYAEKTAPWVPTFLAPFLDPYTLYVFRDPRDLFLSANSMNSQRGYLAFGRLAADSDYDHAITLSYRYLRYFESYKVFKSCGRRFSLVRYEDAARDPQSAFAHLRDTTGLEPRLTPEQDFYSQHRTTTSVEDSIERWKRQPIEPEVISVLESILFEALQELGYQTSPSVTGQERLPMDLLEGLSPDLQNLSFQDSAGQRIADSGLQVEANGNSFEMALEIPDVPASAIKEIWLCLSGDSGSMCELSWSGSAQGLAQEPNLVSKYDAGRPVNIVRMRVANHERWQGTITRLNFKLSHDQQGLDFQGPAIIRWLKVIPSEGNSRSPASAPTGGKPQRSFFHKLIGGS